MPIACAAVIGTARADEGMWTYDNFPSAMVREKFGANIDQPWLDRVRQATVRLAGCTASFVSPQALVITNHHCAWGSLQYNSTPEKDLRKDGFLAVDGALLGNPVGPRVTVTAQMRRGLFK